MLDLHRTNWGNLSANIDFLTRTGLLQEPRRVLEIGCGQGRLLQILHDAGHIAAGIDLAQEALDRCPSGLDVRVAEGTQLPFGAAAFDLVLSFDVFEHIPDSDRHLAEVRRVLKPGGHYLLQTPNKWTNIPFEIVRWSSTRGIRRTFDFLKPPEHCALHSYRELKRRLTANHFEVKFYDVKVVNDYFSEKVRSYLGQIGVLSLKVINPDRLPRPLRTNFYVQARKVGARADSHHSGSYPAAVK
jgi:SAM-dependent methyltransferase